jgi:ABC-type transporter Mla MlaB component
MGLRNDCAFVWDTASEALAVSGSLTADNVDLLASSLGERLPANTRLRRLRVDCAGVTECDPTGLATLLTLRRRADELGVEFELAASAELAMFLELTGTDGYLTGSHATEGGSSRQRLRLG